MFKRLSICCIFIIILWGCSGTRAVELGISPPDVHLNLNPGQTYQGEVKVFGSDREPVAVNIYPMDWSLSAAGDYQFLPAGILKRSIVPWLTLDLQNFSLPPGTGQKVRYRLRVPDNASGSYWGVIMCGAVPKPAAGKDRMQIAMTGRMAYLIRVDVDSPAPSCVIEGYQLRWDAARHKLKVNLRLKNNGASFVYFRGYLELKDLQGQKVGMIPMQNGLILPDSSRAVQWGDGNLALEPGTYIGLAVVDAGTRSLQAVQGTVEVQ